MTRAPPFVCLIGVDGVGKSTQAQLLSQRLKRDGLNPRIVWLRFSHVLSLPVLVLARVLGVSYRRRSGEGVIGFHEFWRKPWLGRVYGRALYADLLFARWFKALVPHRLGSAIICDRFVLDTAVDYSLATTPPEREPDVLNSQFLSLLPANARTILLDADSESIQKRRPDLALDPAWNKRARLYRQFARLPGVVVIAADQTPDGVHQRILESLQ